MHTPDSNCCLLVHICISIAIGSNAYTGVCIVANCNGNAYVHEQTTIGIWCTHCGRKYLNWCMPFGPCSSNYTVTELWFIGRHATAEWLFVSRLDAMCVTVGVWDSSRVCPGITHVSWMRQDGMGTSQAGAKRREELWTNYAFDIFIYPACMHNTTTPEKSDRKLVTPWTHFDIGIHIVACHLSKGS